jgi:hypothetical protein
MMCFSCGKSKNKLSPTKSTIMDGIQLFMCELCIDAGYEPRWVIILAGRQKGPEHIKNFIIKKLYLGKVITAEEIIA